MIDTDTLGSRIKSARINKKLTQRQLAELIGSAHSSISEWESGKHSPDTEQIELIAGILEVDITWLIVGNKKSNTQIPFEETELLNRYRKLNTRGKLMVDTVLNLEYERYLEEFETSATLEKVAEPSDTYTTKHKVKVLGQVAAGLPIEAIEDIEFLEVNSVPHGTDFALRVKGDSMKPLIHDGSIIYIHSQSNLDCDGEICVVQYNNETTCKKVYRMDDHIELHSLNPKYEPMIVRCEDFKILGKVIFP